jgi:hypothetical protein
MKLAGILYKLFPRLRARAAAREAATRLCRTVLPDEPILGSAICADEPGRYVVRVFCGHRPASAETYLLPPWRVCLVFAVAKDTYSAAQLADDEKYRPTIR